MSKPEYITAANESELEEIAWTIEAYQGKFLLIFARCNYAKLRKRLAQGLTEICPVAIHSLTLQPDDQILFNKIRISLGTETPNAVMVLGLESVVNLEQMIASADQVREEFRKNFPFPLVLWTSDRIYDKLMKLAPNLESWGISTKFTITTTELRDLLRRGTNHIFAQAFSGYSYRLSLSRDIDTTDYQEMKIALQNLQSRGEKLKPNLEASLEFAFGQQAYLHNKLDKALDHYYKSLAFWEISPPSPSIMGGTREESPSNLGDLEGKTQLQLKIAIIKFNLGLCYLQQAEITSPDNSTATYNPESLKNARNYLQQSLNIFKQANRPDLVIKFSQPLGDVFQKQKAWNKLKQFAQQLLTSPSISSFISSSISSSISPLSLQTPPHLHGFLAIVALQTNKWQEVKKEAQTALEIALQADTESPSPQGRYLLLLAEAEYHLGQPQTAIRHLERGREVGVEDDVQLYLQILKRLRDIYFEQKQYLDAYRIKQKSQFVQQKYGLRAFTEATEIVASDREEDIKSLVERVIRPDYKVIVLYGYSGVGKSSLVHTGLIPILAKTTVGLQSIVPVSMRVYTDWLKELGQRLTKALEDKGIKLKQPLDSQAAIVKHLQESEAQNLRVVLIFDQFEEFFFVSDTQVSHNEFFLFLGKCLAVLPVKVIFSIRRDYLHYLADRPGMESIDDDILSKNVLYKIGNFSAKEAQEIIERLTKQSAFSLEPALIDQLIKDLAGKYDKVRPIELQVVGAQLQEENITTLEKYQQFGTKEKLVNGYLDTVVKDCGEKNQQIANLVLYLLTDERGTRPLKTRSELQRELKDLGTDLTLNGSQLDLVLELLVVSGLVFLVPDSPFDRYQLVHDYLVSFIRQQQEPKLTALIAELEEERKQRQQAEVEREKAEQSRRILAKANQKAKQRVQIGSVILGITLVTAAVIAGLSGMRVSDANQREANADQREADAEQKVTTANQKVTTANQKVTTANQKVATAEQKVAVANQKIATADQRVAAARNREIEANKKVKQSETTVQQARKDILAAEAERKRVEEEAEEKIKVADEQVNNAEQKIADAQVREEEAQTKVAAAQKRLKQAQTDVKKAQELLTQAETEREEAIVGTQLERQGTYALRQFEFNQLEALLTAIKAGQGLQKIVKDGRKLEKYPTVSPNLALQTILHKLPARTDLKDHQDRVISVVFSPDGERILTASADKTARLWDRSGRILATLTGHQNTVYSAVFSPDGERILTASTDKTARLWDRSGRVLATLIGHQDSVNSAVFSPDGEKIVTASVDGTARIWDKSGRELATLIGHQDRVISAVFSPDGEKIVTASLDNTARIWDKSGTVQATLTGHQNTVYSAVFSPDGERILTASADKTARLWDKSGEELATLSGHQDSVWSAVFSPDGEKIVTASSDDTARLWDKSGKKLATLSGHQDSVWSAVFSPDGERILTASADGTARIWQVESLEQLLERGCDWIRDYLTNSPNVREEDRGLCG